ncbi:amiloride-sensitive sodium channel domain-containing protein [Phthorimaea operculella]|nr:amiloride-sensitive sodium channel domain-containing protein [Phthorimaea operculella]
MKRTKRKVRVNLSLEKRLIFLGRHSGLHGLAHLFRENAPFFARLFWLVVVLVSLGCLYVLLMHVVTAGSEVSYTAETRYLPWTTSFPGVTICEIYIAKLAQKKLTALYPDLMKPLTFDLQRYLTDLTFASRAISCRKGLCDPCGVNVPCDIDWKTVIQQIRKTCAEMLTECKFNGKPFPCCDHFRQVDSESGPCYTFNTLQSNDPSNGPLFSVNRSTGPGKLTFHVLSDVRISVHSTEELATTYLDDKFIFEARPQVRLDNNVEYTFSMVDFENDVMLANEEITTRGCRYLHEVPDDEFDTYKVSSVYKEVG